MTKEKTKKEVPEEIPVADQSKSTESLFYIHQLREHSRELFGVKPEVLDGVFKNHPSNQVTKSEAKNKIDTFLKKKVGKEKEGEQ
ncbi:hypothetical protein SporoP37_00450 [Sporosarcina sp. P37]|uniref:hypothetical protein n=1 Tax=unclassified Sporosarcina TaxID=2647733 RepID=UPI000A1798F1|nr:MULTISPECIES: hypothetical protein [unclassified Sporosarcina]ARK23309.1 hypothetical protein SporoP37_00450 [Sporosarcina sp. P37]PID19561.1 hypothetical protein CSV62_03400 [Sporosarcina sp. P35]